MNEFTTKMNYLISKFIDPNLSISGGSNSNNGSGNNSGASSPLTTAGGSGSNSPNLNISTEKPKLKYKHWCTTVDKKIHTINGLMPLLEASFSTSEEKKKEKVLLSYQKFNTVLQELVALLEVTTYKPNITHKSLEWNSHTNSTPTANGESDSPPSSFFLSTSPGSPVVSPYSVSPTSTPIIVPDEINVHSLNNNNSNSSNSNSNGHHHHHHNNNSTTNGLLATINNYKDMVNNHKDKESSTNNNNSNTAGSSLTSAKATKVILITCREALLQVWGSLQSFIEKYFQLDKDFSLIYQCMLLICKRKEFDSSVSIIDPITQKPWSLSPNDILAKYRYRLYKTFFFVSSTLSSRSFYSIPTIHFCSKYLSLSYFRIPKVARMILESINPPENEIQDIISHFPCPSHLKHLNIVGDRPDKSPFHTSLMQMSSASNISNSNSSSNNSNNIPLTSSLNMQNNNSNNESLTYEELFDQKSHGWVDNLARKETVYFIFFKEWFLNCKYILGENVDMKSVPGFFTIAYSLLHEVKTRDQAQPPLSKPTPCLDAQFTLISSCRLDNMIEVMIKILFLKTSVYDVASVSITLSLSEAWLKEHGILSDSFDINFFCEGIEGIIKSDHHQLLIRAFQMLYNSSESFQGAFRKKLFGDLLLTKYFYQLFLHWDQPVRNAYHHLLLYKMVRIKRANLYESGFSIGEFSKLTHVNTPITKSLSPAKFIEGSKDESHNYGSSSRLVSNSAYSSMIPKPIYSSAPPPSILSSSSSSSPSSPSSPSSSSNPGSPSTSQIKKVAPPVPPRPRVFKSNRNPMPMPEGGISNNNNSNSNNNNSLESEDSFVFVENPNDHPPLPIPPPKPSHLSSSSLSSTPSPISSPAEPSSSKVAIPSSLKTEKFSKEYSLDIELFLEIEIFVKKVQDQMRDPELKYHDPILSHYVASSISEFKTYIAHANQIDAVPPKIIPLMFANSAAIANYRD
ncbi:hypothetical protein CYY_003650 [Polysphondylium violaceum]|uniref:Uncharacterized protein n=1 Tax=Polysphondylium violaceum TaxID=133409 RepID=A0A8J4PWG1_9MYCE|nr:hypothetical protein CYY_003650 [Polysphondylium violaceum]